MSWSLERKQIAKVAAAAVFKAAHEEQGAYSYDGPHKAVMDEISAFSGKLADAAPDGSDVSLSSYGHFNQDGTGSCTVTVSIGKPMAMPASEAP